MPPSHSGGRCYFKNNSGIQIIDGIKGGMYHSESDQRSEKSSHQRSITVPLLLSGLLVLTAILSRVVITFGTNEAISAAVTEYTHRFSAGFGRIFLEAIPFLLLGALAAAVVEHLFSAEEVSTIYSKRLATGLAAGLLTGFIFPVGEGGSILLARALIRKGASIPAAVALMLVAPAVSILPLAVSLGSGGSGTAFWLRTGFGVGFAILFAVLISFEHEPNQILHPEVAKFRQLHGENIGQPAVKPDHRQLKAIGATTAGEFLEFLPYVIAAALAAAAVQIILPVDWIPPVQGGVLAQIGSAGLWAVLSAQSSVGDLLTLNTSSATWTLASQTVFLTLGALVDVKLVVLYAHLFRKKIVIYLIALAFAAAGLAGLISAFFWGRS